MREVHANCGVRNKFFQQFVTAQRSLFMHRAYFAIYIQVHAIRSTSRFNFVYRSPRNSRNVSINYAANPPGFSISRARTCGKKSVKNLRPIYLLNRSRSRKSFTSKFCETPRHAEHKHRDANVHRHILMKFLRGAAPRANRITRRSSPLSLSLLNMPRVE